MKKKRIFVEPKNAFFGSRKIEEICRPSVSPASNKLSVVTQNFSRNAYIYTFPTIQATN